MKQDLRITREIFNHSFWTEKRAFSKFEAWIDLISLAQTSEKKCKITYMLSGKPVVFWLKEGELPITINGASLCWNWTRHKTRAFLEELTQNRQIKVKLRTKKIQVIEICNFLKYKWGQTQLQQPENQIPGIEEVIERHKTDTFSKNVLNSQKSHIIIKEIYSKEYSKKELSDDSETKQNIDFLKFQEWMHENAPICSSLVFFPRQFTEEEFLELKAQYTGSEIAAVIEKLDNRSDLHGKYYHLPRTVKSWLKNEGKQPKNENL